MNTRVANIVLVLTILLLVKLLVSTGYWWYQLQNVLLIIGNIAVIGHINKDA